MAPVPNWTNLERNILSAFEEQAVNVPGQPHERSLGLIHSRDVPNPFDESNPKPKTPIIAGTVCGGVVFLAWVIGFSIYFHKRYRRKKRKRLAAEGKAEHPDAAAEEEAPQVVVPPDPAVLLGYHRDSDKANNVSPVKAPDKPLHREG